MRYLHLVVFCCLALLVSHATPSAAQGREHADERIAAVLAHAIANPVDPQAVGTHPELPGQAFSRTYNISRSARAYLQLMTDPSKDADSARLLEDVAQYYLDHPEEMPDPDSTYWAGEYHAAILAKFGSNGTVRPAAVPRHVELKLLTYMASYVNYWSRLDHYAFSVTHDTFYYWNSENHWWQETVTAWGYLLALKNDPEFSDLVLTDGRTVSEHYDATVDYMKEHMRQRARKGFFVEISSGGYAGRMHNMYYMIDEISPDAELRRLARLSLDLWWTFWAEEQVSGERGGGKVRHRRLRGLLPNSEGHMPSVWYYHGLGTRNLEYVRSLPQRSMVLPGEYIRLLSDYRPPAFVTEILNDRLSAPAFAVTQRRVGRSAGQDENGPPELINAARGAFSRDTIPEYKFYDIENSDVLKYSWVSPSFVLGTNMRPPHDVREWVAGSAQGWWHGLLLEHPGTPYPQRVVPTLIYPGDSMGEQYAVQSRGSLMARKLNDAWSPNQDNANYPMGVYISDGLRRHTSLEGDFIFINSPTTWVAVRAAGSEFIAANNLLEPQQARAGTFYRLENDTVPVIIEAAEHSDYASFEAFKAAVRAAALSHADGVYDYQSLSGDRLSMFDDRSRPRINGEVINYTPSVAYSSRYLYSDWDSGRITVTVAGHQHVLDFMGPA
ncbi:hypothetical protein IP78_08150 [Brevundimonas sp. AAP58]|uniref:hypothetical protein n=1 Tax=Brevundimonas sp. AAP58 TaxID=1523422 RepID=UPI0006B88690|nr:hypothetical protein [Brevundimonas sp. AAP58]KPF79936.1 hypothetical protein IP78_08150 [Brevundimonas sp. AAP58]